ncbi:MAG: alpha/beta hydrolase-fold protein [Terracidiphilus sp.]
MNLDAHTEPKSPHNEPLVAAPPHPRLRFHRAFHSRFLPDDRDLIVYLPPGYDHHPGRDYPVLYMHDGQNLFDPETSFIRGRTWQMREHADAVIESGEVEPLIIVGIYNTGDSRIGEYTPDRDWQRGGGKAGNYGRLIVDELMPFIAHNYRVRDGRGSTGLGGSSLGALATLYLGLRFAQHFGKLAVLSPSVWWNHKSILSFLNERSPETWERPRLWLDVGEREGRRTVQDAEHLARRLLATGWDRGDTLHFERFPEGAHDETSWAARVRPMLCFLFPAQ